MELVASHQFSRGDISAFYHGLYEGEGLRAISPQSVHSWAMSSREAAVRPGARFLSWLVATQRLAVSVALTKDANRSIYHEKFGVLTDQEGFRVSFVGSTNESMSAYTKNYERIEVYPSGREGVESDKTALLDLQFEQLWWNETPLLRVLRLHHAFLEGVLEERDPRQPAEAEKEARSLLHPAPPEELLRLPVNLTLRDHQRQAVDAWFAAGGRGIFAMATGAGKTVAALAVAARIRERFPDPLVIVVVVPYLALVDQWIAEARSFGLEPIPCSDSRKRWEKPLRSAIYRCNRGLRQILSVVVTNATFASKHFQDCLQQLKTRTILIGDEVHNLGARQLRDVLPTQISLRLGLSATPERWMDSDGTEAVSQYFGDVCSTFTIQHALAGDSPVLCPYSYYPVLVPLEDDERQRYLLLTRQLAQYVKKPSSDDLSDQALYLLLERARLVAGARGKIEALRRSIQPLKDRTHILVYCGDGTMREEGLFPYDVLENDVWTYKQTRQISRVTELLRQDLRMDVRRYTYEESRQVRRRLLADFRDGTIQGLVAIRCLDEGLDIPKIRRAFILASSTNPRQFIQRRGRVLRHATGKDFAEIWDFVVVPPGEDLERGGVEYKVLRGLVERELARVIDFCETARNKYQARSALLPITRAFDLDHL